MRVSNPDARQAMRPHLRADLAERPIARGSVAGVTGEVSRAGTERVVERRRAVSLAHHYREFEGLSIRQIADRLGRSPATVKAYF
jgi:DNA-binding NarL/FixJ family response regulator